MKSPLSKAQLLNARRTLAANVRWHRLKQGWSQDEFATAAGVHRTYVSLIERVLVDPTFGVVVRLAAALRIRTDALLRPRKWSRPRHPGRPSPGRK